MHVTKVETNIKVGASVVLGPKTLILGGNFSGKSTIVNAIEAALTGRVSDVAGRETLALDAELWTLAPPGAESVFARVVNDSGDAYSWTLEKGRKAKRESRPGANDSLVAEVALPLRDVYTNLTASPEKARKWLLDVAVGDAISWSDVEKLVSAAQIERLATLTGKNPGALASVLDTAKSQARDTRRRGETLREEARRAAAAGAQVAIADPAEDPSARIVEMQTALAESRQRLEVAKQKLDAKRAERAKLPAPNTSTAEVAKALRIILDAQISNGATKCVCCARENPPQAYIDRRAWAKQKLDDTLAAQRVIEAADREINALAAEALRLGNEVQIRDASVRAAQSVRVEAKAEVTDDAAQRLDAEATKAEEEAAKWEKLADEIDNCITVLVERARTSFEKRVQRFLPAGFTFGLDLKDEKRDVCRFGLREATGLRSALSGVEWATVTVAIAEAVANGPAVLIPEDRSFDRATLRKVLDAFGRCESQVIIATTTEPESIPPEWTVIRTPLGTAVPAPPPPVKRGRGRPRKDQVAALNAIVEQAKPAAADLHDGGTPEAEPTVVTEADDFASMFED